jgi:serine/threonine protein kinase
MAGPSWVGHVFNNRYEVLELLGQGGMSAVYKANDPNLKRVVAVKLIHAHLSNNQDFLRRFEEEATAVAQLRHPNIVQVFDYSHEDETYYMVLEFVPGETLQARLHRLNQAGRRMPAEEAVRYALDVCDAVDYAHKRGMVHRDIKPANIMLDIHGHAILMDFGIAKIVGSQTHTATGAVVGTAMYMSPEMIQGESPDPRSDIYSLGVTLFEALSGQPPFKADSAMTLMMMHLNDPLPNLHKLVPDVPDILIGVIEKALAKRREDRFQSAAEMTRALKVALGRIQSGVAATSTEIGSPAGPATSLETGSEQRPSTNTYVETSPDAQRVPPPMPSIHSQNTSIESGQPTSPNTYQQQFPSGQYVPNQTVSGSGAQTYTAPPPGGAPPPGVGSYPAGGPGPQHPPHRSNRMLFIGGGAIALLAVICLALAVIFALPRLFNNGNGSASLPPGTGGDLTATAQAVVLAEASPTITEAAPPTEAHTATEAPTVTTEPTDTPAPPTETPTPTLSPTPTVPPGIKYVRINNITVEGDHYVVEYETFLYTELLPGEHVHFFFNTVPPEQAGNPGSGPWILYGGPRPFEGYKLNAKPAAATEMCALVANPNHSIQMNSGNCFPLPTP